MVVQAGVIAPVAEVEVLRYAQAQRAGLPDVQAHALIKPENAVEVDYAGLSAEIALYAL